MPHRIIYVDDNEQNLVAFKALSRRRYEVFVTTRAKPALEMIGEHDIAVVITDFKMPEMTGVEFLAETRKRYPNTVRILMSGHADIKAVVDSVNQGEVFRFIKKPWEDELLLNEIANACELYETRIRLRVKNDELQKAYRELSNFTYSAAHNLTGPIATIQGLTSLIRLEPENWEEYLTYIESTLFSLSAHLKNIISFNRNKLNEANLELIDLQSIVSSILNDHSTDPGFGEVDIQTKVDVDGPVLTDHVRLTIILTNLIGNAIKYRDNAKQQCTVFLNASMSDGALKITVEDNGLGIESDNASKVFDIFFRESSDQFGSGIGLYIVKEAVNMLKGEITVNSEKGRGSRFEVTLPLEQ